MFNPIQSVAQKTLAKFDEEDHNLLGGLQLVAKVLEVWFVFITAALVYIVTMHLAAKHEGLPIGYLTRPIEFADPVTLVDPLLWTTGPSPFGRKGPGEKKLGMRVWFLIILSVALCILCNLMGPAIAVLAIPTLQWIETDKVGQRQFVDLNSAQPPMLTSDAWFFWNSVGCSEAQLEAHEYGCAYEPYGKALDAWMASYASTAGKNTGVTPQDYLTFAANSTSIDSGTGAFDYEMKDVVFWSPSRQIVSNLSTDYLITMAYSQGFNASYIADFAAQREIGLLPDPLETYVEYNRSRSLEIHRNGPINGAIINIWLGFNDTINTWTVDVDAQRQIRCYGAYDLSLTPIAPFTSSGNYTKCIRTGSGWSENNKQATFSVEGMVDTSRRNNTGPSVDVQIYSSDKAAFLPNGTLPEWLPEACLTNSTALNRTNCDWERLFTVDEKSSIANRSANINTIEYTMRDGNATFQLNTDFCGILGFTDYSLSASPMTNPTAFVTNSDLPTNGTSIIIDPTWILAGWAVY